MNKTKSLISVVPADKSLPHHKSVLFVQGIPMTTKVAFKAACAAQNVSMRDALIKMMRKFAAPTIREDT